MRALFKYKDGTLIAATVMEVCYDRDGQFMTLSSEPGVAYVISNISESQANPYIKALACEGFADLTGYVAS